MKNTLLANKKSKISIPTYLSVKDLIDLNCFAINKKLTVYAISSTNIYTLMRNIPEEIMYESIEKHLPIRVRNIQQLKNISNSLSIRQIILSSSIKQIDEVKQEIPNWITERFFIIKEKNKIILSSKSSING